ncbi:MAG: DNA polymerase III subunit alpha [Chloroflexi bacterium]|nr:DNA polymerase III subunit alpha [Chloroflexota bacterium]
MDNFTHLHIHSQYTLLGSTASVEALTSRALADGLPHLALTDTNALYGAVTFAKACQKVGIRPIIGMTVTVALPQDLSARIDDAHIPGYLVLLATGPTGYHSLCRLSSLIQGGPDRKVRASRGLSMDDLQAQWEGLICLGGGRKGWTERCLRAGDAQAAHWFVERLARVYGKNTYLSLELHRPEDVVIAHEIVSLGESLGLPAVAVQPIYCLSLQDVPRLKLLAAIDRNCSLDKVSATDLPHGGDLDVTVHWLDQDEMTDRFAAFPDTLARVGAVAAQCEPALPEGKPIWPVLDLPEDQTPDRALIDLARSGLMERYGSDLLPVARERLERELISINQYGYAPLFIIVADVVRFARQAKIAISTRGSVANSLVAYCTGITTVDPIAHDLLFERFISPARTDIPDIDLDFCSRRRDEVLDYVRHKYGADRVSLVATVSRMRLRSAVRETAKAHGLDKAQTKQLAAHLPRGWSRDPRQRGERTVDDVMVGLNDPLLQKVVREAFAIKGQPHHLSVHPGAVVITPGPLTDIVPVQWAAKGFLITQFDFRDIETLGLPKLDLLGISALTVLADASTLIQRHYDPIFRLADIPFDDPDTRDLLARGETVGVFQCDSNGARSTLRKLQARSIRDLAVANAFFKPGPATGGMAQTFVRRYRGAEAVTYLHPALEPILDSTKGVLIFQEQILRVAREIAGLSWEQAGYLRRGMSKMNSKEMARMEAEFIQGCQRPFPQGPNFTPEQARRLWEQVAVFSGYGFNQGHATAYADVSYRMAYLKAHWPAAFFCARLANWGGYHHPAVYMAEAIRLGIEIRPPHVNFSERHFTLVWEDSRAVLWMGLGQVRDLRRSMLRSIVAERRQRPFTNLRDLVGRVSPQTKEVTHLIQCGALDGLGESRAALTAEAEEIERAGSVLQMSLFGGGVLGQSDVKSESWRQRIAWEKHLLGYPVSALDEPLKLVENQLPERVSLRRLPEMVGRTVTVIGVRLPGWGRGESFYLWDGETWVTVRLNKSQKRPPSWEPVLLRGRWIGDEWETYWLQVIEMRTLDMTKPRGIPEK